MSKRNRREHGRILSVETMQRGSALDVDAAAGATSITVSDAGDFDEDGGWLFIGAQVIQFTAVDDDAGTITLVDPMTSAAEQGDPVNVYDPLYGEVVDYQVALVQLDGDYDNPDPVEAEVAEGVEDLPEGDRGRAGESCTLLRIADDEWEIIGVGGRPRQSRGVKFYQDAHTVAVAGTQAVPLTFLPITNSEHLYWNGLYQPGSEWSRDGRTVVVPDAGGVLTAGDLVTVEYAYRDGIATTSAGPSLAGLPLVGWFSADYLATIYADGAAVTSWPNVAGGFEAFDFTGTATFRAAEGGRPALEQAGGADSMLLNIGSPWAADPGSNEAFFVMKVDTAAGGDLQNFGSYSGDTIYSQALVRDDFASTTAIEFAPTLGVTDWRRYNTWSATNDRAIYLDEVLQASSATNVRGFPASQPGGGSIGNTAGTGLNGHYSAILLFNAKLTADQRAQVVEYLQAHPGGGLP